MHYIVRHFYILSLSRWPFSQCCFIRQPYSKCFLTCYTFMNSEVALPSAAKLSTCRPSEGWIFCCVTASPGRGPNLTSLRSCSEGSFSSPRTTWLAKGALGARPRLQGWNRGHSVPATSAVLQVSQNAQASHRPSYIAWHSLSYPLKRHHWISLSSPRGKRQKEKNTKEQRKSSHLKNMSAR